MIVVATDAPLLSRNLKRLASRAILGLARCGGFCSNGSGDYVIAFSTHEGCRIRPSREMTRAVVEVGNDRMSPLFLAVVEATEEAVLNSLFMAETVTGRNGVTMEALPVDSVLEICRKYNVLQWERKLPPYGVDGK
jgi:D-aminopeptidase